MESCGRSHGLKSVPKAKRLLCIRRQVKVTSPKIVVTAYDDAPVGLGEVLKNGAGKFNAAVLRPHITMKEGADLAVAHEIHHRIQEVCFITRSVNFPVRYEPTFNLA